MADSEMLREILKCKSCSPFSTFGLRFSIPLLNSILTMTPVFFMKYKYETLFFYVMTIWRHQFWGVSRPRPSPSSDDVIYEQPLIAIYQKDLSNKAQDCSEYSLVSSFNVTKWLFFLSSYKNSLSVPLFEKFFGSPFLFSHLQWSLWVTSWLTLQYLATSARKNLCVPATITQAERVFSWMEWLLKKEGFVCQENLSTQHATILEGQSGLSIAFVIKMCFWP